MAAILTPILKSILFSLLTEAFIKNFAIHALEEAVKLSDNNVDDKIVADVKKAWNVN